MSRTRLGVFCLRVSGRKLYPQQHAVSQTLTDHNCRLGEISSGIVCGCMPTLPQFFRHFAPKIATAFSSTRRSSGRGKSVEFSASTEQSGHSRTSKARFPKSPYGDTDSYVELDERRHQYNQMDGSKGGPRVWSDEVSASDVEKGPPSMEEDGVARVVMH